MVELGEESANPLVASDCCAAGFEDQHGDRLEALDHACVAELTSSIQPNLVTPHGMAHVEVHQVYHDLAVGSCQVKFEQIGAIVVGDSRWVLGIFVGEGLGAGARTAGLHKCACFAYCDVRT